MNIIEALTSIAGLSTLVVGLTEAVTKAILSVFNYTLNGWKAWVASLLISEVVTILAAYLQLGIFADAAISIYPFYTVGAIVGAVACLVANGVFSLEAAKVVLDLLKIRVPVEKK